MRTNIKVGDAMTKDPIKCRPEEYILDCIKKMIKNKVNSILVTEEDNLIGIITEKDIIKKITLKNKNAKTTKAKEIMSTELNTIEPHKDIYDAIVLMGQLDTRRLPVIQNNKLTGLITYKDILRIQPALLELILSNLEIREIEKLNQKFY